MQKLPLLPLFEHCAHSLTAICSLPCHCARVCTPGGSACGEPARIVTPCMQQTYVVSDRLQRAPNIPCKQPGSNGATLRTMSVGVEKVAMHANFHPVGRQ